MREIWNQERWNIFHVVMLAVVNAILWKGLEFVAAVQYVFLLIRNDERIELVRRLRSYGKGK